LAFVSISEQMDCHYAERQGDQATLAGVVSITQINCWETKKGKNER